MQKLVLLTAALCGANATSLSTKKGLFGKDVHEGSFVHQVDDIKHRLRVCNAYPYSGALDVFRGKSQKLTDDHPLPYKGCRDFKLPLREGDRLEFRVGDANAGTFSVSDLPQNDAVLFLAIYRHDTLSTAVSFESHVFANLLNAQIAVIDTYKGKRHSQLKIEDHDGKTGRSEALRYDSVVAVNPGRYRAVLSDGDKQEASQELITLNRESYVVLRVGVEAQEGESFPQDLIVFPHSDARLLSSAYSKSAVFSAALALVAGALFF